MVAGWLQSISANQFMHQSKLTVKEMTMRDVVFNYSDPEGHFVLLKHGFDRTRSPESGSMGRIIDITKDGHRVSTLQQ